MKQNMYIYETCMETMIEIPIEIGFHVYGVCRIQLLI